jgi:glutamyl-tRNA(Gln) amidotransferase subunit D
VMHGTSNDDYCLINRGTRVRKLHSSRRDAFKPVNQRSLAKIWADGKMEMSGIDYRKFDEREVEANTSWEPKVALIKVFPNSDPSVIDWYLEKKYRGLVIEGFGLGHVPTGRSGTDVFGFDPKLSWIPHIKKAVESGVTVMITSQTIFGRVHPFVYKNLRILGDTGAIFSGDMLTETALIKLSWVLGQTEDKEKIREMMLTSFANELSPRTDLNSFVRSE